jgi:ABC-type lipoprotein release transport system permease subunit
MLIFNIAWKNIWRNRFRSIIIMSAITLGIFGGLLLVSFSKGMTIQRVSSALNTEIAHIQIHQPDFIIKEDIKMLIDPIDHIGRILDGDDRILSYSSRLLLNSIASSAETGTNVKVNGINVEKERKVTDLFTKITEGSYFEKEARNPIVISQKLREKLKLKLNSKLVLQIQDIRGNIAPAAFRIVGIYKTSNTAFDEFNVFVRKSDLYNLTGIDSTSAHEVFIMLKDYLQSKNVAISLQQKFPSLEVKSWKERSLMLSYLNDAMDQYLYIIIVIILIALLFGIINTMMMAVLERVKELGMLRAIGMGKGRIFRMIVLETVLLSLTGAVLGIIMGMATIGYYGKVGIDLSIWGKGLEEVGFDPIVYTVIDNFFIVIVVILVVSTGILASIFPAMKALRLKPVEALRSE